jgi:GntR family transcriptional regulator, transcriptional repressor for pyruvate dehydrogenase complex
MAITRIQRAPSLVQEVCQRLADEVAAKIATGGGCLPPERELAEQLGVSRPVIREATKRLELQGLVEIQHGIGIKVADKLHKPLNESLKLLIPDETQRLAQLNETRLAIEPEAARLAAERASDATVSRLWAIHQRLTDAKDTAEAIDRDMEFHRALAEAGGNLMFRLILDSLAEIGRTSRQRTIGRIGKATAIEQHLKVLEAIDGRDPIAAADAMRQHILAAGKDMALDLNDVLQRERTKTKTRRPTTAH